jgi:hypothetical protein
LRIDSDWTVVDQAMGPYNDAARAVAAEFKVSFFDLARQLPKSDEYFYDEVHFNPRGATVGAMLALFASENTRLRKALRQVPRQRCVAAPQHWSPRR